MGWRQLAMSSELLWLRIPQSPKVGHLLFCAHCFYCSTATQASSLFQNWMACLVDANFIFSCSSSMEYEIMPDPNVSIYFLDSGALTGKYTPDNPPKGPRGRIYTPEFLTKVEFPTSFCDCCALFPDRLCPALKSLKVSPMMPCSSSRLSTGSRRLEGTTGGPQPRCSSSISISMSLSIHQSSISQCLSLCVL